MHHAEFSLLLISLPTRIRRYIAFEKYLPWYRIFWPKKKVLVNIYLENHNKIPAYIIAGLNWTEGREKRNGKRHGSNAAFKSKSWFNHDSFYGTSAQNISVHNPVEQHSKTNSTAHCFYTFSISIHSSPWLATAMGWASKSTYTPMTINLSLWIHKRIS